VGFPQASYQALCAGKVAPLCQVDSQLQIVQLAGNTKHNARSGGRKDPQLITSGSTMHGLQFIHMSDSKVLMCIRNVEVHF